MASRNISETEMLFKEKVLSVGPEDWVKKCRYIEELEVNEYLAQETAIDNIVENLVISIISDSESDSESLDDANEGLIDIEELD